MTPKTSTPNCTERWLAGVALLCVLAAGAAHGYDTHTHGAHVHGAAELDAAQDGNTLSFFLRAPGASLAGFERAPKTAAERAHLAQLKADFARPATLIVPTPAARCTATPARVQFDGFDGTGGHADIDAEIVFTCAAPEKLTGFSVPAFARHPHLKTLKLAWVGPTGQRATTLTPGKPAFAWR
jgi:hypothetical protein